MTSKRFLTVGSFLRPADLLEYKEKIEHRDDITYPFYEDFKGYRETEEQAVNQIVAEQIEAGLPEITDGEFSRSLWHLDFFWGFEGVRRFIADHGYFFQEEAHSHTTDYNFETRKDIGIEITAPLTSKKHPFIAHYVRTRELTPDNVEVKLTIPSPGHLYGELTGRPESFSNVYATPAELAEGMKIAYTQFFEQFAAVGGKIIQLDDCVWSLFAKDNPTGFHNNPAMTEEEIEGIALSFINLNNAAIDAAHALGLTVYTHNCRGNYASRNAMAGSYGEVAKFFLERQNYDRFYLEWDDSRAGGLDALKVFENKPNTEVVLGFLSSKTTTLADEKEVLAQLEEATQYVDKDKLFLSHQCGFASCDCGNELSSEQQWAKIKQGQAIALAFWGE